MTGTKTIHVPHLGGIDVGYQMSHPYDPSKPTLVLINSFTTSSKLYHAQYQDPRISNTANLLAIELLGHGETRTDRADQWTYWDTAIMNLQSLDALGIEKAFVCGTSQGGWITVRMALLAPDRIEGIIPLGTSLDYESDRTVKLGCWEGFKVVSGIMEQWTNEVTPSFEPDNSYCDFLVDIGFGKGCTNAVREFWVREIKKNYQGDDGRKRAHMAAINLRDRDGLHGRLFDVRCPVLWVHGTDDAVYSVANAEKEIKLFTNSVSAELVVIKDGQHFLSASHPEEVNKALVEFIKRWHNSSGKD